MIKLIATDLDGTFLDSKKNKPADFPEVFKEIKRRGITFAAASGRDYNGAAMYFKDYIDDMYFICDNGASLYKKGRLISARTMSREKYLTLLKSLYSLGITDLLVCGVKGSYVGANSSPDYLEVMKNHYSPAKVVGRLEDIEDEIFKVSVTDLKGNGGLKEDVYLPLLNIFNNNEFTIHISGMRFLDIMDFSADKGVGVKELQAELGILPAETMVFGDYYNDEPLLQSAEYAFIMDAAPRDLKEKYKYNGGDCNCGGVTKNIKEWAFDKIK